jgi:hypothetical protein
MSTMMLKHLVKQVISGARNLGGFKSVHHNNHAKALNEYFKLVLTTE